jgi:hypothetical protein
MCVACVVICFIDQQYSQTHQHFQTGSFSFSFLSSTINFIAESLDLAALQVKIQPISNNIIAPN